MQNSRNSDVAGIEKNWWEDPKDQEQKWLDYYQQNDPKVKSNKAQEPVEESRDHYTEMVQLKAKHNERYMLIKQKMAKLQSQLQNATTAQEAQELRNEIAKRQIKIKQMKEDDQFIQLLTGQ